MEDSIEELEPLFDYRRVQPVNFVSLDDDSDCSPYTSPKRRKTSNCNNKNKGGEKNKEGKASVEIIVCEEEEDDEEDWLPPPPKNPVAVSKVEDDDALRELRLRKQELTLLAMSADDTLRAADEVEKKAVASFSHTPLQDTEELPKPPSDRAKIVISIQDKTGTRQYRVYADESFEQLFKKYAEKEKVDLGNLVFCFDGDKVNPALTPQGLGMEDDDLIEVHVKAR